MKLRHSELSLPARDTWLPARLAHAPDARGLCLIWQTFADPADRDLEPPLAEAFQQTGHATLMLDLLSATQWRDPDARYNIAALGERALAALEWIHHQPDLAMLPLGIFAADTAAAAAIRVAAQRPDRIAALGLFAGRPDLAGGAPLRALRTPTCFIVGQDDPRLPTLRQVFDLIAATRDWRTTAGAEPEQMSAALLAVGADIAAAWMQSHLPARPGDRNAAPRAPGASFPPAPEK
ncbi:MAG: alpha/beta hydrolase [Azoarcus sp.]|nr:alpha/beta hydrolase [Azoarcus sp.]